MNNKLTAKQLIKYSSIATFIWLQIHWFFNERAEIFNDLSVLINSIATIMLFILYCIFVFNYFNKKSSLKTRRFFEILIVLFMTIISITNGIYIYSNPSMWSGAWATDTLLIEIMRILPLQIMNLVAIVFLFIEPPKVIANSSEQWTITSTKDTLFFSIWSIVALLTLLTTTKLLPTLPRDYWQFFRSFSTIAILWTLSRRASVFYHERYLYYAIFIGYSFAMIITNGIFIILESAMLQQLLTQFEISTFTVQMAIGMNIIQMLIIFVWLGHYLHSECSKNKQQKRRK